MKFFGKTTFQLVDGNTVGSFVLRTDEVSDGFGLSQVKLTIDESATGELTSFGHAAAMCNQYLQEFLLDKYRTMHTNLRRILAGERVGGFEEGNQHLVKQIAIVYNMAVISLMRDHIFLIERLPILYKQLTDNRKGFWT